MIGVAALALFLTFLPQNPQPGHSLYGPAHDEGPRTRPIQLAPIGHVHFPVSSKVPEVQVWFDQGQALLHSFEYWEAERTFRWCVKLDPDCATAWWGLARAVGPDSERFEEMIREAVRRKANVSERERRYIEAWAKAYEPDLAGAWELRDEKDRDKTEALVGELEQIVLLYPDDLEAKALLVNHGLDSSRRIANEALLREIERVAPEHPGLHHYRIHLWDGEDGVQALASCQLYGRIASALGHPNHMPGHVYSSMGLWHEAGIWMESATRVELAAMNARQVFPFQYWNFPHNRNYLAYIQEQLGQPSAALAGARDLLATPRDSESNDEEDEHGGGPYHQGKQALIRALLKFERWDEILAPDSIPWREAEMELAQRAWAECFAHLGRGELHDAQAKVAELGRLADEAKENQESFEEVYREARAYLRLAQGDDLAALAEITTLAERQTREFHDDPPAHPWLHWNKLGEALLARGAPELARQAFEEALEVVRNDAFALAGLARARHALGDISGAREAAGRLMHVWSAAEPGLHWIEEVHALLPDAEPIEASAGKQRIYGGTDLSALGPLSWQPWLAPELQVLDSEEKAVRLAEYRDQNVLLVFYLGEQCAHCVEQLAELGQSADAFAERGTALLAVSSDSPEKNRAALARAPHAFRLLSDLSRESARRFQAWDDFEDLELHATILIDRLGRVRWARVGGEPFMDVDFLLAELDRWKAAAQ